MQAVKVGDLYPTWFSGKNHGCSTVLAILPYTGCYPQWFNCVLRLSAPNTSRKWIEMAIQQESASELHH